MRNKVIKIDGDDVVGIILAILIVIIMAVVVLGQPECSEESVEGCTHHESTDSSHNPT